MSGVESWDTMGLTIRGSGACAACVLLLALGCEGGARPERPDADAPIDGGDGPDAGPDAGSTADAGAPTDAGPGGDDAGPIDPCVSCAARRCDAAAGRCAGSAACHALVECLAFCGSLACVEACSAGRSPEEVADANALLRCMPICGIACALMPLTPRPEMCQPLLAPCEPAVTGFDCCEAACVEPDGTCCEDGYCCASGDRPCGPAHPCCRGDCDAATSRCILPTCTEVACDGTLPCCDPRQICSGSGIAGMTCCFPDGAVIATDESGHCCSFSTERVSDTEVRCIPRP